MICVECTNPDIDCLYSEFKSKYIKLTICPKCGALADKYIEFDNVIVFLDILLLKPQAYRHLAYNVVEDAIFSNRDELTSSFLYRYKSLMRYCVLAILFEVYLIWAYEEKNSTHTRLNLQALLAPVAWQYSFFIGLQLTERVTFCLMTDFLYKKVMKWPRSASKNVRTQDQAAYYSCVLLVTTCTSLAVKCLPIIMLIWPYDNAMVASAVVGVLGIFSTIEALRINTGSSYLATSAIVLISTLVLVAIKQVSMCLVVSCFVPSETFLSLLHSEMSLLLHEARSFVALVDYSLTRAWEFSF